MATILNYDFDGISETCEYYYQKHKHVAYIAYLKKCVKGFSSNLVQAPIWTHRWTD